MIESTMPYAEFEADFDSWAGQHIEAFEKIVRSVLDTDTSDSTEVSQLLIDFFRADPRRMQHLQYLPRLLDGIFYKRVVAIEYKGDVLDYAKQMSHAQAVELVGKIAGLENAAGRMSFFAKRSADQCDECVDSVTTKIIEILMGNTQE